MKILRNKRFPLRRILLTLVCAVIVATAYVELRHRYDFGHFVPYGLHVDVLSDEISIGIPGQKMMYRAELSNFSFLPVPLEACDYLTDAFGRGTEYPYAVQRWDSGEHNWKTIVEPSGDDFCHPAPLSTIETHRVSRRLWPGMHVQIVEGEATGAVQGFQKGDSARFVIFKSLGENLDWQNAVSSPPFIIQDDVLRGDGAFRVRH